MKQVMTEAQKLTQRRYKAALRDIIFKIKNDAFIASKWTQEWKIINMFVRAAIQLDYIKRDKRNYTTELKEEDVTDERIVKLQAKIRELVVIRDTNSAKSKEHITNPRPEDKIRTKSPKNVTVEYTKGVHLPKETIAEKHRDKNYSFATGFVDQVTNVMALRIGKLEERLLKAQEPPEAEKVFKPLSDWEDDNLMIELATRGFSGTLERLQGANGVSRLESIEIGVVKKEENKN